MIFRHAEIISGGMILFRDPHPHPYPHPYICIREELEAGRTMGSRQHRTDRASATVNKTETA